MLIRCLNLNWPIKYFHVFFFFILEGLVVAAATVASMTGSGDMMVFISFKMVEGTENLFPEEVRTCGGDSCLSLCQAFYMWRNARLFLCRSGL